MLEFGDDVSIVKSNIKCDNVIGFYGDWCPLNATEGPHRNFDSFILFLYGTQQAVLTVFRRKRNARTQKAYR